MPTSMPDAVASGPVLYRERLTPPWWGWLLAAFWASTLGIAYGYAIATLVGWAVGVGLFLVAGVALVRMSALITVSATALRAGRASIPTSVVERAEALDTDRAHRMRGTEADSRAYVVLRGWVSRAVIVTLNDSSDPTPYWYLSSRRPEALASALEPVIHASTSGEGHDDVTGSAE